MSGKQDLGLDEFGELTIKCLDTGQVVGAKEVISQVTRIPVPEPTTRPRIPSDHRPSTVRVHSQNEVGEIVGPSGHKASTLAKSLQLGIRYCVSRTEARAMTQKEPEGGLFKEVQRVNFPKDGSATTPAHDMGDFKFKDYMPTVFKKLRECFEVDMGVFLVSLCHTLPDGSNALRIMGTPGKSGSLFFFSHDMRFIVKTLPPVECKLLREIMEEYMDYISKNPKSLLPRFFGLYRFTPDFGRSVRFVVMNNIFASRHQIHIRYDLKGSTLGRRANLEEKLKFGQKAVLKDLDLLQNNTKIRIGWQAKKQLMDQMEKDTALLARLNIMDYSLLLGVHLKMSQRPASTRIDTAAAAASIPATVATTNTRLASIPSNSVVNNSNISSPMSASSSSMASPPADESEFLVLPGVSRSLKADDIEVGEEQDRALEEVIQVKDLDSDKVLSFAPIRATSTHTRYDGIDGHVIYFLGIIDILTSYTLKKSLEMGLKKEGASVLPPPRYANRFMSFLQEVFE